jgi:hypothetical protein
MVTSLKRTVSVKWAVCENGVWAMRNLACEYLGSYNFTDIYSF